MSKILLISGISHFDNKIKASRHIISLNGIPFYCSSGSASTFPGTWFPFLGIDRGGFIPGQYIKPENANLPEDLTKTIEKLFPSYGSENAGRQLLTRFGSETGIIISSWLGGGLWKEKNGQNLKAFIKKKYSEFYPSKIPQFSPVEKEFTDEEAAQVNAWICNKAKIKIIAKIGKRFPQQLIKQKWYDGIKVRWAPQFERYVERMKNNQDSAQEEGIAEKGREHQASKLSKLL